MKMHNQKSIISTLISKPRLSPAALLVVSVLALIFSSVQVFAHTHSPVNLNSLTAEQKAILAEPRLIDTGDGKPRWVTFGETFELSEKAHMDGRCGGYFDLTDAPEIVNNDTLPMVEWFKLDLNDRPMTQASYLSDALKNLDSKSIQATVAKLSSFKNRYYQAPTGIEAAEWIASQYRSLAKSRSDVQVELFKHNAWAQPSVIATLRGQKKPDEIVVIGGHLDSINQGGWGSNSQTAPGADDNASGTATVMEVFKVLVQTGFRPDRTIMFMGYAAEEVGLRGSQEIANTFKNQGKAVVAVAQFDMTGFNGSRGNIVFMTDFVSADLTKYAAKLVDTYVKAPWSTDKCGYACSDHASWTKAGYAAIMPFETKTGEMNRAIHTTNDLIGRLDFDHALMFARLGLSFVAELSRD